MRPALPFALALLPLLFAPSQGLGQPPELLDTYYVPSGYSVTPVAMDTVGPDHVAIVGWRWSQWDYDPFLMLVGPGGEVIWQLLDSPVINEPEDLCVSGDRICVAGDYEVEAYSFDGTRLGHISASNQGLHWVVPDGDGGIVTTGQHNNAIYVGRFDADGNEVWSLAHQGTTGNRWEPASVQKRPGGGWVAAGKVLYYLPGEIASDAVLLEISDTGEVLAEHIHGMDAWSTEYTDVLPLPDGGFVASGRMRQDMFEEHAYVAGVDADGLVQWVTPVGYDLHSRINRLTAYQGGVLAAGGTSATNPNYPVGTLWYLLPDGELYWETEVSYPHQDIVTLPDESLKVLAGPAATRLHVFGPGRMIELSLVPVGAPVILPAGGGTFSYSATLTNPSALLFQGGAWVTVTLPDGSPCGPLLAQPVTLLAGQTVTVTLDQAVPAGAPAGSYDYGAQLGAMGVGAFTGDAFEVVKEAAGEGPRIDWPAPHVRR